MAGATVALRERARAATNSIDESGFVRIGGIDQWIAIQGSDLGNPAILYLHGGPGEAQSPFLKEFIPWEKDFTVINWDQRGSGKTFGRNGPSTPGMSTPAEAVGRLTSDAIEVAAYARRRLAKKKLILVGQSWGTQLGQLVIHERPELFHAFVGTAMIVSWTQEVAAQQSWARQEASKAGDQATLDALDLPASDTRHNMAVRKYRMSPPDMAYIGAVLGQFTGQPPFPTHGDVTDWLGGYQFSGLRLTPALTSFDARKLGLNIAIPFYVIQGRDDHIVFAAAAKAFVADIHAPKSAFIPIAGGHFACFTNPNEFVDALRRLVRPLAM